jgi:hypothetical protein
MVRFTRLASGPGALGQSPVECIFDDPQARCSGPAFRLGPTPQARAGQWLPQNSLHNGSIAVHFLLPAVRHCSEGAWSASILDITPHDQLVADSPSLLCPCPTFRSCISVCSSRLHGSDQLRMAILYQGSLPHSVWVPHRHLFALHLLYYFFWTPPQHSAAWLSRVLAKMHLQRHEPEHCTCGTFEAPVHAL